MLRLLVDSGSSIKLDEQDKYNCEIIPLKILLEDDEYLDGVDLPLDVFYKKLMDDKIFPKTSLPNLGDLEEKVNAYTSAGDDVIILTISSEISGSFNAIEHLFAGNNKVRVLDSRMAVGGMRFIVEEINRNGDKSLDEIENAVKNLIPRIKIMAIPETLEYLMRGGRLSKFEGIIGSILSIKPIIGFKNGKVSVLAKKIGLKMGMSYIAEELKKQNCDVSYGLIASYTYSKTNLDKLIELCDKKYTEHITAFDNLDPAIACHWGPNAFGFVFVSEK